MTMATTETFFDMLNLMLFVVLSDEKENILTILELYVRIWGHIFLRLLFCVTPCQPKYIQNFPFFPFSKI